MIRDMEPSELMQLLEFAAAKLKMAADHQQADADEVGTDASRGQFR